MHLFKDSKGNEWDVSINVGSARDVKSLLDISLYELIDDGVKGLGALLADPSRLVDVLYVLCRGQCKERGISDEDFGRAFNGDTLEAAADAFTEELVDFFRPAARPAMRKMLAKGKEIGQLQLAEMDQRLDSLDMKRMLRQMEAIAESNPDLSTEEIASRAARQSLKSGPALGSSGSNLGE